VAQDTTVSASVVRMEIGQREVNVGITLGRPTGQIRFEVLLFSVDDCVESKPVGTKPSTGNDDLDINIDRQPATSYYAPNHGSNQSSSFVEGME